jgi:hypothetical protein
MTTKFKVAFVSGAYKTIEADDHYTVDERLLVFESDGKVVLTAVLANTLFFEPVTAETSRQDALGDLFAVNASTN